MQPRQMLTKSSCPDDVLIITIILNRKIRRLERQWSVYVFLSEYEWKPTTLTLIVSVCFLGLRLVKRSTFIGRGLIR